MDASLKEKLTVAFGRMRVSEFLRDFDKVNIKRIDPVQAVRALSSCGVVLSRNEQEALKAEYTAPDGLFDYGRLVDDFNDRRPNGFFEAQPDLPVESTTPAARLDLDASISSTATMLLPRAKLTADEELEVRRILNIARHEAHNRALIVSRYMKQYDETGHGVVTATRFTREILSCFKLLRPGDATLLAKAYAAPDGQVRYIALHQDISPDPAPTQPVEHGRSTSPNVRYMRSVYNGQARSGEQAKAALATCIRRFYEKRIRSTDLFRPYDPLSKGHVLRPIFIRVLGALKLEDLTLGDMEALADGYADTGADAGAQLIRWRDFCDDIEAAEYLRPTLLSLEGNPLAGNTTFARQVVQEMDPAHVRPAMDEGVKAKLHAAMADIRGHVQRSRTYRIVDMLGDFDKSHEGHVTPDRFLRVLAMCGCPPRRPEDRDILISFYRGVGSKGGLVNYRSFIHDLDLQSLGFQG